MNVIYPPAREYVKVSFLTDCKFQVTVSSHIKVSTSFGILHMRKAIFRRYDSSVKVAKNL